MDTDAGSTRSEDSAAEFVEALQKGLKKRALQISEHPDFDSDARDGLPLRVSIELGYTDIAARLLDAGADANAAAGKSKSPIVLALENEYCPSDGRHKPRGPSVSVTATQAPASHFSADCETKGVRGNANSSPSPPSMIQITSRWVQRWAM